MVERHATAALIFHAVNDHPTALGIFKSDHRRRLSAGVRIHPGGDHLRRIGGLQEADPPGRTQKGQRRSQILARSAAEFRIVKLLGGHHPRELTAFHRLPDPLQTDLIPEPALQQDLRRDAIQQHPPGQPASQFVLRNDPGTLPVQGKNVRFIVGGGNSGRLQSAHQRITILLQIAVRGAGFQLLTEAVIIAVT